MAISKIILNGVTQMDLTQDTVAASNLIAPNTAHGADGNLITGTANAAPADCYMFPLEQNEDNIWIPITTNFSDIAAAQTNRLNPIGYNSAASMFIWTSYFENYEGFSEALSYNYEESYTDSNDSRNYGTAYVGVTHGYYNNTLKTIYSLYPNYDTSYATATADKILSGYTAFGPNGIIDGTLSLQAKTNIAPTTSSQTITADSGYGGLSSVQINAIPTMTLPTSATTSATSGFTSKATISRSTSDQYINIPTGYNSSGAYYKINAVANGTEGTPTATKGTVSNHQVSITPSVTNTAGYISGGAKTGTAVTVTANELASGNKSISANGTNIDVVGYSTVSVAVPFSTITVSSSNPTGGNNGDIWIKTS